LEASLRASIRLLSELQMELNSVLMPSYSLTLVRTVVTRSERIFKISTSLSVNGISVTLLVTLTTPTTLSPILRGTLRRDRDSY